jgi:flagellar M-ring protein FliF
MEEQERRGPLGVALARVRELNDRLTPTQKMALSGLVVVLILAVSAAVWFANDTEMAALYSNLDEKQAGRIAEDLRNRKVDYELAGGGTVIMVPSQQVYELRLQMATTGIVGTGSTGYELIEKSEFFGMPEDVIEVTKKRMLEGELARSVSSFDEVAAARVHLALPKDSLFVEDQKPASASVVVQLERGARLSPFQVKGIVNLVAGAVSGLEVEQITVVNQRGKVLNRKSPDSIDGSTSFDYRRTLERDLENKATEVLERVVGSGRAVVRVKANIDFSREERTEEAYDPEKQVVRSEESLNEVRANGGNRVGGAAGANPNDPNVAQGVVRVGDASNSNREKVVTNYEINKVIRHVKGPGATVTRLSIAVIVDGTYKTPKDIKAEEIDPDNPPLEYVPRSADEMQKFRSLVMKAVEYDVARGDQIEVQNLQFSDEDTKAAEAQLRAAELKESLRFWTRMAIVVVIALIFVFLVFRPMVNHLTEQPELAEVLDGQLPKSEDSALPGEEAFDESEYEMVPIAEKLVAYCRANPQTAADVLSHWLRSEPEQGRHARSEDESNVLAA